MSLDRSPSPNRDGGWSSPGLVTSPTGEQSNGRLHGKGKRYIAELNGGVGVGSNVTWESARANSARVNGSVYTSYQQGQNQNQGRGYFSRHLKRVSSGLPAFYQGGRETRYAEKEKLGRGRIPGSLFSGWRHWRLRDWREVPRRLAWMLSRRRKLVAVVMLFVLGIVLMNNKTARYYYRRHSTLGGGSNFVIILGANQGGGVMEWKGPREWAIERDSVKNKKRYAAEWGYEMEIVDMATKKRYAHEWRESWEKVDVIRNAMRKYPDAEWFWWLDLNSFIMEPGYSLQSLLFNDLAANTYRDINIYNPLHIPHPPNTTDLSPDSLTQNQQYLNYLDPLTLSPTSDNLPSSINLLITQDCSGFNLGSFFVRRSAWTDRLLDIWWDPVFYEQRHMAWEHKEQDALEYLYRNQPWIRTGVAFVPQRLVNAFPNGACGDDRGLPPDGCGGGGSSGGKKNKFLSQTPQEGEKAWECGVQGIHYQESERDFLVNMAGCEWGRDCWGEMYNFRQLSNHLNRSGWEKFKDWVGEVVKGGRK